MVSLTEVHMSREGPIADSLEAIRQFMTVALVDAISLMIDIVFHTAFRTILKPPGLHMFPNIDLEVHHDFSSSRH